MSKITLVLSNARYTIDRQLLISNHSQFLKTLLDTYPNEKEFELPPFPIKSLDKFICYINGNSNNIDLDYDEFIIHLYLDTKGYFDHLIYLMIMHRPNYGKINSLHNNLSWEIYNHLPLNMVPKEMLTDEFIERYRTKVLPEYPENVRITRNERELKTEILISGNYCIDGRYRSWYENGQMNEKSNWLEGEKDGLFESWYPNGEKYERSNWLKGKRHGLLEYWYQGGQKLEESNWSEGEKHGLFESWLWDGRRLQHSYWSEGKKDGLFQTWYLTNENRERSNWSQGERHGLFESWYFNGQEQEKSNWSHGKGHGSFECWYENGHKRKEHNYSHGKGYGLFQSWHQNGEKEDESIWVEGKKERL